MTFNGTSGFTGATWLYDVMCLHGGPRHNETKAPYKIGRVSSGNYKLASSAVQDFMGTGIMECWNV
eukprot:867312-Amphidinium_carterae.2